MYCGKCGFKNIDGASFCGSCGNSLVNSGTVNNTVGNEQPIYNMNNSKSNFANFTNNTNQMVSTASNNQSNVNNMDASMIGQTYNYGYQNTNGNNNSNKSKIYILIITIGIALIILLSILAIWISGGEIASANSRTIMIYMAGTDLESGSGLATADLNAVLPTEVDLDSTNILVYAGGTKEWYNDFNENENAIYLLKGTGFEKVQSYSLANLGDTNTFVTFLNYAYENYKADKFDLIFWNHGLGVLGSISDENTQDFLSIKEMDEAFKQSGFAKEKVIETVTFRTCLNGTLEVADTFAPYAKYMVASEEITIGSPSSNVLGFLNGIEVSDNGIEYGTKFIDSYKKQVEDIDFFGTVDSTYSIIDLEDIDEVITSLGNFVEKIDVSKNYSEIARVRSNLHQYAEGSGSTDYDTVDLYDLVTELQAYAPSEAKELLDDIEEAVEYNWATNDSSSGIAIYFPFKSSKSLQTLHLNLYNQIDFSEKYFQFINKFYSIKNNSTVSSFNLQTREVVSDNDREFSIQLTEEEVKNFASAEYIIFQKSEDNYYMPILSSSNYKLDDNGVLTTDVSNNLLKLKDKDSGKEYYAQAFEIDSADKYREYRTHAVLLYFGDGERLSSFKTDAAAINVKVDKNNIPHISKVTKITSGNIGIVTLKIEDYEYIQFTNYKYKILDDNGNYNENWESSDVYNLVELKIGDLEEELVVGSLDDADNYYCIFRIYDITNNYHYSNLVKIN